MELKTLIGEPWPDYGLIDSGNGRKLERYGRFRFIRPEPQAMWQPASDDWRADGEFIPGSDEDGGGRWYYEQPVPAEGWPLRWKDVSFQSSCTPFRHLGFFPDMAPVWDDLRGSIADKPDAEVMNLFGYTGMMSLACAAAGAEVVHLDASPKSNGYGKDNQAMSGLQDRSIRWIADDAMKFTAREVRRGNEYDAIILDPPKFGRGPKNETWRFEENLPELLDVVKQLLSDRPLFVILTAYAVRLSYLALSQALADRLSPLGGVMETGEMALPQQGSDRLLPTAIYARWHAGA